MQETSTRNQEDCGVGRSSKKKRVPFPLHTKNLPARGTCGRRATLKPVSTQNVLPAGSGIPPFVDTDPVLLMASERTCVSKNEKDTCTRKPQHPFTVRA